MHDSARMPTIMLLCMCSRPAICIRVLVCVRHHTTLGAGTTEERVRHARARYFCHFACAALLSRNYGVGARAAPRG